MAEPHTLVLGTAFGLHVPDVWVFVESLRRHYEGDAVMLVNSKDMGLVNYLLSRRIMPVFFDTPYWMICHVQVGRYIRYGELLRPASRPFERILLTDVSDVMFQANPFAGLPDGQLLCFQEESGHLIGGDETNSRWVEQIFGPEGLQLVKDKPISCSGTTIGSHLAILTYIDQMLSCANPAVLDEHRTYRGHDQGIHNYLLHTGALAGARLVPNGEFVLTMGTMTDESFRRVQRGIILTANGRLCPIVHQYNYCADTLEHVRAAYPLPD
jgi:hypothetical protein